jgi:hypothetical protein
MSFEDDLNTLSDYLIENGETCCPPQDIASNYRKAIQRRLKRKPAEIKPCFKFVINDQNEVILDCTFKVNGMFFGFFSIHRCKYTKKWSKNGRYYLRPLFGCGSTEYDCGAITGLNEAKALALLNTRLLLSSLQNVNLK